eukprot:XP_019929771.1 PREDICTED: uncharacterized protein LOC105345611 [Crassostrea gigas]
MNLMIQVECRRGICSFLTVAEEYTRIHSPHHSRELCRIGSLNLVVLPGHGPQRIAGQRSVYQLSLGPLMKPWILPQKPPAGRLPLAEFPPFVPWPLVFLKHFDNFCKYFLLAVSKMV